MRRKVRAEATKRQAFLGEARLATGEARLREEQTRLLKLWASHPWQWLQARDTDGSPVIWTKDESDPENPIKPFPAENYLRCMTEELYDGANNPLLFFNKPRQIMATWNSLLTVDWFCRFELSRLWLVSKSTEEEAKVMLHDKVQHVHQHLPTWVREALPLHARPAHRYRYPSSGSQLWAVAENAAEREFRGNTASGILIDEAAFQTHFREMVAAAIPMQGRIIALTTPNLGNDGATYCREIVG